MSATKIHRPVYKVSEPGYHPQQPIIVDEEIESPETLTIRLEEAARDGGDLGGPCPSGLLPMSEFKSQLPQMHGYAGSTYPQYHSAQPFSPQHPENAASQVNQIAFVANGSATGGPYLAAQAAPAISVEVLSWHPTAGAPGIKVSVKVSCQHDLLGGPMAAAPLVSLLFGSQRCRAQVARNSRDGDSGRGSTNGSSTFTVTAEAPQPFSLSLNSVPLTLLVESAGGVELARVPDFGVFGYHHVPGVAGEGNVAIAAPGDNSPPDLASPKTRSPVHRISPPPHQDLQTRVASPAQAAHGGLSRDSSTNAYGFPLSVPAASAATPMHAQSAGHTDFAGAATGAYNQGGSSMLSGYRGPFADPYARSPTALRSPHVHGAGWMFGGPVDSVRGSASALSHTTHVSVTRPGSSRLHYPNPGMPQLARTSTITQSAGSGYGVYQEHVKLKIIGSLSSMAEGWTQEEWASKRRLVLFKKQQTGSTLTLTFKAVKPAERPPHSICISCIWWEERRSCYVTSVDTIHLLEQILAAPNRFGVEEKNRIRRNLEGFQPTTVSKARSESENFFKVIMAFGNPKPRNIEKDVKVFRWADLEAAISKIISKYSALITTAMPPSGSSHVAATAVGYPTVPTLPPTPVSTPSAASTDAVAVAGYGAAASGHRHPDPLASPRALAPAPSWPTYGAAARVMSPELKQASPSALRMSALPAVYDHRGITHSLASPYGITGPSHHNPHHGHGGYSPSAIPASQSQTRSWQSYPPDTAGYPSQPGGGHGQVYGGAAYGNGAPRA